MIKQNLLAIGKNLNESCFFCMFVVMYALLILVQILKVVYPVLLQGSWIYIYISFWKEKFIPSISSVNRSGIEPSSTYSSQAPHHLMRGPLRETYNPKSSSLSASNSSSTQQQQQQQVSKIPEKINKCVFSVRIKPIIFSLSSIIIKYQI